MKMGKLPESMLKRSVLRQIHRGHEEKGVGEDCAFFPCDKRCAVCTQEAVIVPEDKLFDALEGNEIPTTVSLLIAKAVNNLAAGGALAKVICISLICPVNTQESEIKTIMQEASQVCTQSSLTILGGQTRVSDAVKGIVAVITCMGEAMEGTLAMAAPDQDVVLSKWIGLEGTYLLAGHHGEQIRQRYPEYLLEEALSFAQYYSILPEAATAVKSGVCAMHDVSEGGILGGLWEIAERAGVGLKIDMKKIPIRQETVEICECCNTNPYEMKSEGCLLMITEDGPGLVEALEAEQISAAIIGRTTDSNDRVIVNGEDIRYLDKPCQDALYRHPFTDREIGKGE